jgi:hypothetical protein
MQGARFNPQLNYAMIENLFSVSLSKYYKGLPADKKRDAKNESKKYTILFSSNELFVMKKTTTVAGKEVMKAIHLVVKPNGTLAIEYEPANRDTEDYFEFAVGYLSGKFPYAGYPSPPVVMSPTEGQQMEYVDFLADKKIPEDVTKYVLAPMLSGKTISPSDTRLAKIDAKFHDVMVKAMNFVKIYNKRGQDVNRAAGQPSEVSDEQVKQAQATYLAADKELDELIAEDERISAEEAKNLAERKKREARTMPPSSSSSSSSAAPPSLLSLAPQSTSSSSSSSSSGPAAAGAPQNGQARRKKTRRSLRKKRTTRRR